MKWPSNLFGRKPGKAAAKPVATLKKISADVYELRVSAMLNKPTMDKVLEIGKREFARGVSDLKLLVVVENFLGWKKGDDWSDMEFFSEYGDRMSRIAAVADPKWETDILMFLGAGRRSGEVRFYVPAREAEARAWLAEDA